MKTEDKQYRYHCGRCGKCFFGSIPENNIEKIFSQNALCHDCAKEVAEEINLFGIRCS